MFLWCAKGVCVTDAIIETDGLTILFRRVCVVRRGGGIYANKNGGRLLAQRNEYDKG